VKQRILKYLLEAGSGVTADQILRDVLNIHSPNLYSSDSILAGFLGQDSRFVFADGLWHLSPLPQEPVPFDLSQAMILHIQSPNRSETMQSLRGTIRLPDGHLQEFTVQTSADIFSRLSSSLDDLLLVMWSSREFRLWNGLLRSKGLEIRRGDKVYLRDLAARVLKRTASNLQPDEVASKLGVLPADEERPRDGIRYLNECWLLLMDRIPAAHRLNSDSLREWMEATGGAVDFSRFEFGQDFLRRLPSTSGVYIMRDCMGTVLYVGKSRNLKRRVSSYFTPRGLCQPKIARIHEQLHSIEIRRTDNEIEALLMEMRLIKEFHPSINLQIEVQERNPDRHGGRNLLLFAIDAELNGVKIYLLRNGVFAGRHAALLGRPPAKRLRERIKSLFFGEGRSRKRPGEIWEKEIVSRWLAANRKRLNYLDVDAAEDFAALLAQLRYYLCDPDKLIHKVYYR
jgi:hypothetical protein